MVAGDKVRARDGEDGSSRRLELDAHTLKMADLLPSIILRKSE